MLNEVLMLRLNYELAPKPHEYITENDFQDEDDTLGLDYLIEN